MPLFTSLLSVEISLQRIQPPALTATFSRLFDTFVVDEAPPTQLVFREGNHWKKYPGCKKDGQ